MQEGIVSSCNYTKLIYSSLQLIMLLVLPAGLLHTVQLLIRNRCDMQHRLHKSSFYLVNFHHVEITLSIVKYC